MIKLFSILLAGTLFFTSCTRLSDGILGGLSGNYWTQEATGLGGARSVGRTGTANLGPFTPGTFEGVGPKGHYDVVRVAVTFDETRITTLEVTYSIETQAFADMAFGALIPGVLTAQTYETDAFS